MKKFFGLCAWVFIQGTFSDGEGSVQLTSLYQKIINEKSR